MRPRLLAYMVTRNEEGRYLDACLTHAMSYLGGLAVYDDRSDDDTVELAEKHGAVVRIRPDVAPSFLEHEGLFRQRAWWWFEAALEPDPGDWVLALDADELLVDPDPLVFLESKSTYALLHIPEVFGADLGAGGVYENPQIRVDGFWASNVHPRLFRYERGGTFKNKVMACGAVPTYVTDPGSVPPAGRGGSLLHLGYMVDADRRVKYERYSGLEHGHSNAHIESILRPPTLQPWLGPWPEVWRGVRGG